MIERALHAARQAAERQCQPEESSGIPHARVNGFRRSCVYSLKRSQVTAVIYPGLLSYGFGHSGVLRFPLVSARVQRTLIREENNDKADLVVHVGNNAAHLWPGRLLRRRRGRWRRGRQRHSERNQRGDYT